MDETAMTFYTSLSNINVMWVRVIIIKIADLNIFGYDENTK